MHLVRRDENGHARPQRMLPIAFEDHPAAFQHEYLMFVGVGVLGSMAAGGKLELPHRETGGIVLGADQATHATIGGALEGHWSGLDLFAMDDFHGLKDFRGQDLEKLRGTEEVVEKRLSILL
jgi:hypothetical protein